MSSDGAHLVKEEDDFTPGTKKMGHSHSRYEVEKQLGLRREDGALLLIKLRPIHRTMIALHIEGKSNKAIGKELGRSFINVCTVLADPLAQTEIMRAVEASRAQLKTLQILAVDAVSEALSSPVLEEQMKGIDRYIKLGDAIGIHAESGETAEDVVQRILKGVQLNVQVNGDNTQVAVSVDGEGVKHGHSC